MYRFELMEAANNPMASAMKYQKLLSPTKAGVCELKHRVVMSALTRLRNDLISESPTDLVKLYYSQRATDGGLIISEGTAPSAGGRGYVRAPGVWTDAHIEGWKKVTEAVHAKGGYIFCQLMHAGRISHSNLLPGNQLPVAPSAIKPAGDIHITGGKKVQYEEPRALKTDEVPIIVQEFVTAARRALDGGFDGVEIHAGNGYLPQQFLAKETNLRTDQYGGSVENRARFVLEVTDAIAGAIGPDRLGIKFQQGVTFSGLVEPEDDSLAQLAYLGPELEKRKLAYVCLSSLNYEPYYQYLGLKEPNFKTDVWRYFRNVYKGYLMINGGLTPEKGDEYVADGTADAVIFGVPFIANANLPELLAAGYSSEQLNQGGWQAKVWYGNALGGPDEQGYTDWPLVKP
ncbi:hypothetical protein R1sor_005011 [Riccia sorocarpa]|uniref:NADH:flavin oxidoreductase/NADH oxidase N-terminal domain-containing protein n=1 Tax=Riccia sorocarpa TaxID=122646 RepID=A0ABD3HM39_9MARC